MASYTRACAVDFLERANPAPAPGTWVVSVYRDVNGERIHLCTIRMRWPAPPP